MDACGYPLIVDSFTPIIIRVGSLSILLSSNFRPYLTHWVALSQISTDWNYSFSSVKPLDESRVWTGESRLFRVAPGAKMRWVWRHHMLRLPLSVYGMFCAPNQSGRGSTCTVHCIVPFDHVKCQSCHPNHIVGLEPEPSAQLVNYAMHNTTQHHVHSKVGLDSLKFAGFCFWVMTWTSTYFNIACY